MVFVCSLDHNYIYCTVCRFNLQRGPFQLRLIWLSDDSPGSKPEVEAPNNPHLAHGM